MKRTPRRARACRVLIALECGHRRVPKRVFEQFSAHAIAIIGLIEATKGEKEKDRRPGVAHVQVDLVAVLWV